MPYIHPVQREVLRGGGMPQNAGELNFMICDLIEAYRLAHAPDTYALFNEIVGVLGSAKAEFQRVVVGPYEDKKRDLNGTVFS